MRGIKAVGRGIRAGAKSVRGAVASGASRLGRGASELGRGIKRGFERVNGRSSPKQVLPGHEFATAKNFTLIDADGSKLVRHGPVNPGPLHYRDNEVLDTFRSSSYSARTLAQPKDLYRTYSQKDKKFRAYWTDIPPSGPLQSTIDSALLPSFGNEATRVVHIRVPPGETIFEGFSAGQLEDPGVNLLGGGRQIVVDNVKPEWEVK